MNNSLIDFFTILSDGENKKILILLTKNSLEKTLEENACFFCRLSKSDIYLSNLHKYDKYFDKFSINKKNSDFLEICCPFCGQYSISKKVIEHTWDKPIIRQKLTSIAQERKLKGQDSYTLVWNGEPNEQPEKAICEKASNKIFLSDYPSTNEEKIDRILLNIYQICNSFKSDKFEINPLQFGLFYLDESVGNDLNYLYKYKWDTFRIDSSITNWNTKYYSSDSEINWRFHVRNFIIINRIKETLNILCDKKFLIKI